MSLSSSESPSSSSNVRGLRAMDVFNHQDKLSEVIVLPKKWNWFTHPHVPYDTNSPGVVLYCHVDFGVNYCFIVQSSLTNKETETKKPTCTQRKSDTYSLWQWMEKVGIDIFSDLVIYLVISAHLWINTDGESRLCIRSWEI